MLLGCSQDWDPVPWEELPEAWLSEERLHLLPLLPEEATHLEEPCLHLEEEQQPRGEGPRRVQEAHLRARCFLLLSQQQYQRLLLLGWRPLPP